MRQGSSVSHAATIDPAGGIWPTRDIHGQQLAKPLDVSQSLNEFQPVRAKDTDFLLPPSPLVSEQVRSTRPPMALTPDGPMKKIQAAPVHYALMKKDAERVRGGMKMRAPGNADRRIAGRAVVSENVMRKLNRINSEARRLSETKPDRGAERER